MIKKKLYFIYFFLVSGLSNNTRHFDGGWRPGDRGPGVGDQKSGRSTFLPFKTLILMLFKRKDFFENKIRL